MKADHFAGTLVLAAALLGGAYLLSQGSFSVRNVDSGVTKNGELVNSISVAGEGKVFAKPDVLEMRVGVAHTERTTSAALEAVNEDIAQIKEILLAKDLREEDIKTTNLSIRPEYDYTNGRRVLRGQRATQNLSFKVSGVDQNMERATSIIDQVSEINEVMISSINFDIEDKTEYFTSARELAYQKAEQKAKELAKLGDLKLQKPVNISESSVDYGITPMRNFAMEAEMVDGRGAGGTDLPSGQLEIQARVNIVFGIE
jgi:hypothetical protein